MKASILSKLDHLAERYEEVGALLSDGDIISDQNRFRSLSKEYAELEPLVQHYAKYRIALDNIEQAKLLLKDADPDMRDMAQEEMRSGEEERELLALDLQKLLLPKDPKDAKNVFLEIRAGTGGDEAAIFSGDLFRMYSKYAENQRWKFSARARVIMVAIKKLLRELLGKGCFPNSNSSPARTECRECPTPNLKAVFTHPHAQWRSWLKRMRRTPLRSTKTICASTPSARQARAVNISTKLTRPFASLTCQRA